MNSTQLGWLQCNFNGNQEKNNSSVRLALSNVAMRTLISCSDFLGFFSPSFYFFNFT